MLDRVVQTRIIQTPSPESNRTIKERQMKKILWQSLANFHKEESGQDLIEYALVVALIALAAVVGMSSLANGINSAFLKLANILAQKIS